MCPPLCHTTSTSSAVSVERSNAWYIPSFSRNPYMFIPLFAPQVVRRCTLVTQAMDRRTPELVAELSRIVPISKFILSNDTAAQLLALVSCCPERHATYRELLWPRGNQVSVRLPATVLDQVRVRDVGKGCPCGCGASE